MPSSHSSLVVALATATGLRQGFDSPLFAIATVLALLFYMMPKELDGRQGIKQELSIVCCKMLKMLELKWTRI